MPDGSRELSLGCLFCGRPWSQVRKSKEHILAQWMQKHESELLTASQRSYSSGFDLDDQAREFVELPTLVGTKKSSLLTLKTRDVCRPCNNGWMSRLEDAAEPVILRVAAAARNNEDLSLSQMDVLKLAIWCQKTAITYELTSERLRVATVAMGKQLAAGKPLRGSFVSAARHPRDYDLSVALTHINVSKTPWARPGDPECQIAFVAIVYHCVTFLVFITDAPGQQPPPLPLDRWTLLWPTRGPVDYPPMTTLDGNELTRTMVDHSRWLPTVQVPSIRRSPVSPQFRQHN